MTTNTPTLPIQRDPTDQEAHDLKTLDIFSYLKKHTSLRKCAGPGCGRTLKLCNRRNYCDPCTYRIKTA